MKEGKTVEEGRQLKRKDFILEGLDCANCAMKIERGVSTIDGVDVCQVNFATQTLSLQFSEEEGPIIARAEKTIKRLEPHVKLREKADGEDRHANKHQHAHHQHSHSHGHSHDHGNKGMKRMITRLVIGTIIALLAYFLPLEGIVKLSAFLVAYLIIGGDIVWRACANIVRGQLFDEHFLMAIATIGAFAIQEYPEGVAVMLFYQVGELFQGAAVNRSRKSISSLMNIRPDYANVKRGESLEKMSPEDVAIGDIIVIKPGEKIPLDGFVVEGNSSVDTSALTGESMPRDVEPGHDILSGFINKNGVLTVKVTKEYSQSTVAKILELVQNASSRKAQTENFITKFARYYTPVVVIIAALLAVIPPILLEGAAFSEWLYRALIFLVISCPCALVVSIPLGFFGGIGAASKAGILVKGSNYLEALNDVKYAVFDKTGTLTKGVFEVVSVHPANGYAAQDVLKTAAVAEVHSNHPIADSIRKAYGDTVLEAEIYDYEEMPGYGIFATVNGVKVIAGNQKLMVKEEIDFVVREEIGTIVYVAANKEFIGSLVIADQLKEDAARAVTALKQAGIKKTIMLTGDAAAVGASVAEALNIDEVHAELLPHEKVEEIEKLDKRKHAKEKILFVGDGINDTPVLARADVGMAMGGLGSDAAIEAADIVIMTDEPSKIAAAISIAKKTRRVVWQNIVFALGVKALFLLLGAFGVATMWEAVFSDVGVTLIAVLNAMRVLSIKDL